MTTTTPQNNKAASTRTIFMWQFFSGKCICTCAKHNKWYVKSVLISWRQKWLWPAETQERKQTQTSTGLTAKTKVQFYLSIGLFRYIKIQLDSELVRSKTKESGWYVNIFHINSHVFLLSLSSLPHFQAEYLIYRKWPISSQSSFNIITISS